MDTKTKCVFQAQLAADGKFSGWISAIFLNVLAQEPIEFKLFDKKEDAMLYANKSWPNYPWDKYRHCE